MASVPISELEPLEEGAVSQSDELVIVDISASATKKVTTQALVSDALKGLPPQSIPGNIFIPPEVIGSIGTDALADNSITADKMADASSGKYINSLEGLESEGAYVGQVASFNAAAYMWNGIRWTPMSEAAQVTGAANDLLTTTVSNLDGELEIETTFTTVPASRGLYLTYDAAGEIVAGPVAATDIDLASTVTYGVVRVPDGNGLKVNNGDLAIDNSVTPKNLGGIQSISWDGSGLITGARDYAEGDLPYATADLAGVMKVGTGLRTSAGGVVSVNPGDIQYSIPIATPLTPGVVQPLTNRGLEVDAAGGLKVKPYAEDPTFQTATKISYDSNGLIIGGTFLETGDIPPLDFEQIVSGVLQGDRINDKSIPRRALSDFCITFVQEAEPGLDIAYSIGTFWYKESTKILRVFTGTRWAQVGAGGGTSTATLEWAGFIDASTGRITQVTSIGQNQGGFEIGAFPPPATDSLTGYYLIVRVAGDQITVTPGEVYSENDWCICLGAEEEWQRYEQAAGGGGGAANLSDLLDTQIDLVATGHVLTYNADAGKWQNSKFVSGQQYGTVIQQKYSTEISTDPSSVNELEFGEIWCNINSNSPTLYMRTTDPLNPGTDRLSQWSSDDQLTRVESIVVDEPLYNSTDEAFDPDRNPTLGIREATPENAGSMSAADKAKLDALDLSAVDGVQTIAGISPVVVEDVDLEQTGSNLEISVNVVSNVANGLMLATDKILLDGLVNKVQAQSDFNVTDVASAAYIKNKPTNATQAFAGYMSPEDKIKLDNVQDNANAGITEAPIDGQQYCRRNQAWSVITSTGGGTGRAQISAVPPGGSEPGDLWFDTNTGELHVFYNDGDSSQWVNTSTAGGGIWTEGVARPPQMGGNPPVNSRPGDFWLDARTGILYIFYADGDSEQWIACSTGSSGGGSVNGNIPIGATPPQNPIYGDTWIDPDTLALYVYFNDGGSDQWAQVATTTAGSGGPAFTENPPADPRTGDTWIRPSNLKQYVYTGSAWASVVCC